ncbi:hypothetical protein PENTCL1PPCAC_8420, partial [Pristionchus entomophagus]
GGACGSLLVIIILVIVIVVCVKKSKKKKDKNKKEIEQCKTISFDRNAPKTETWQQRWERERREAKRGKTWSGKTPSSMTTLQNSITPTTSSD